jgi:serine/threonine-protein kinase
MPKNNVSALLAGLPLPDLSRYVLEAEIARGDRSTVYFGGREGPGFKRRVAVKVYNEGTLDVVLPYGARAALLNHPGAVAVLDAGTLEGKPAVVMEYIRGISLKAVLAKLAQENRRLPLATGVRIAAQLASALVHAHELEGGQLVHGRVQPAHVICGFDGRVYLCGFGGQVTSRKGPERYYLAPEVRQGREPDMLSDVFSVGAILYELVTGRTVWKAATTSVTSLTDPIPSPSKLNPAVDTDLEELIVSCLEQKASERPESAKALQKLLEVALAEASAMPSPSELADEVNRLFPQGPPLVALPEPKRCDEGTNPGMEIPTNASQKTVVVDVPTAVARALEIPAEPKKLEPKKAAAPVPLPDLSEELDDDPPTVTELSKAAARVAPAREKDPPSRVRTAAVDARRLAELLEEEQEEAYQRNRANKEGRKRIFWAISGVAALIFGGIQLSRSFQPAGATLSVQSDPPGVAVLLDGRDLGRTPVEVSGLTVGVHQLAATLDGFEPQKLPIELGSGKHERLKLSLKKARPAPFPTPAKPGVKPPPPKEAFDSLAGPAPEPVRSEPKKTSKQAATKGKQRSEARPLLGFAQKPGRL